jgi:NDP-hexose-3-ketoreductase
LLSLDCVEKISVASEGGFDIFSIPPEKRGKVFSDYRNALSNSQKGIAYISLPNSLHAEWVEVALNYGFHVVVDKPAFLTYQDYFRLAKIARSNGLCLSEATVWPFQRQIEIALEQIHLNNASIMTMQATFSFPPLESTNFRNKVKYGGGSFNDLATYALTPGRVFFGLEPESIQITFISSNSQKKIDTAFAISAIYPGKKYFQGFFSFETEYKNSLSLLGPDISIEISPAFTSIASVGFIQVKMNNILKNIQFESNNGFAKYFHGVIKSIDNGDWSRWESLLASDCKVINKAREGIKNYD